MADEKHVNKLKQGAEVWNKWRKEHLLDWSGFDLAGADLRGLDLSAVNLSGTVLLIGADLTGANLSHAVLGKDVGEYDHLFDSYYPVLQKATLVRANLSSAIIRDADLREANLKKTNLIGAYILRSSLAGADLRSARMNNAIIRDADLREANLKRADLIGAYVLRSSLAGADLSSARLRNTAFGDVDLSQVKGLATVKHHGPSVIGIDTIYRSKGRIPKSFLRGCGVPDTFIDYTYAFDADTIQRYSCFISHSSHDEEFAKRLFADLQDNGVRCWFAPENMKIGDKIRATLDRQIIEHHKMLLILSERSVKSDWVEQEVETALAQERQRKTPILFPIRLDDAVLKEETGWPALVRNTRHVGDFHNWQDDYFYRQSLSRLLRDLKVGG